MFINNKEYTYVDPSVLLNIKHKYKTICISLCKHIHIN